MKASSYLSYGQEQIWFLSNSSDVNSLYHVSLEFRIVGNFDHAAFQKAFESAVESRPALSLRIAVDDRGSVAASYSHAKPKFVFHPGIVKDPLELASLMTEEAKSPFDLQVGPLLRCRVFVSGNQESTIQFTFHHLIIDGWSIRALFAEISTRYNTRDQKCRKCKHRLHSSNACLTRVLESGSYQPCSCPRKVSVFCNRNGGNDIPAQYCAGIFRNRPWSHFHGTIISAALEFGSRQYLEVDV